MARILRGGIYWADITDGKGHEQAGVRPVLVISHTEFNATSKTAIVIPLTSAEQKAGYPLTLELSNIDLPKKSWLKISQIRTLSTVRLGSLITEVDESTLKKTIQGLNELIN